ncbi:hypothetical protein C495_00750 [Natronorubrum sulfidifaciens JCM 14089]|uniref:Uncharacterized protein n=1 Tax=Natronorubrum sulfidifaciens JCM 14089 TaxID=1230460 RepID=L9WJ27_9EURY|nr:hypothetical protein C495_00750 [Natronorubrum sulfidifaciens JCM 14089]
MQLFGSKMGTVVWLLIGVGTAGLAVHNDNQLTALIAVGWVALAVFSWAEYRKED